MVTVPTVDVQNRRHCDFFIFKILNWFNILHSNITVLKFTSILIISSGNSAFTPKEYSFETKIEIQIPTVRGTSSELKYIKSLLNIYIVIAGCIKTCSLIVLSHTIFSGTPYS